MEISGMGESSKILVKFIGQFLPYCGLCIHPEGLSCKLCCNSLRINKVVLYAICTSYMNNLM